MLEVLSLLAASCGGQMSARVSDLGGVGDIITRDKASAIQIDLSSPVEGHEPLDYQIRLEPSGQGYRIQLEQLAGGPPGGEPGVREGESSVRRSRRRPRSR